MSEQILDRLDIATRAASCFTLPGFEAMKDEAHSADGGLVLRLSGELDMASAPGLARVLDTALDAQPTSIALDLTDLAFLDSCGIRVLITACRRARSEDSSITLRSPCRSVLKSLSLTGVDRLMEIDASHPEG